jgi:sec-independent protein translocase protein TatA
VAPPKAVTEGSTAPPTHILTVIIHPSINQRKGAFIMRASTTELLIVLLVVIVLFGPKQLPKLGKMLGASLKGFKEGMAEADSAEQQEKEEQ